MVELRVIVLIARLLLVLYICDLGSHEGLYDHLKYMQVAKYMQR